MPSSSFSFQLLFFSYCIKSIVDINSSNTLPISCGMILILPIVSSKSVFNVALKVLSFALKPMICQSQVFIRQCIDISWFFLLRCCFGCAAAYLLQWHRHVCHGDLFFLHFLLYHLAIIFHFFNISFFNFLFHFLNQFFIYFRKIIYKI